MLIDPPGCWFSIHRPQPVNLVRRALFLDRDGVIIPDLPYRSEAANLDLANGAADLLGHASDLGMAIIVVTNQSGIGRGYFTWADFAEVNARMIEMLEAERAQVDAVLAAGWHESAHKNDYPTYQREWRKPAPGMLFKAAERLSIDLPGSCMVGDKESDMAAARAAGVGMGLLLSGQTDGTHDLDHAFDQHRVASLRECIPYIEGRPVT